MSKVAIVYWSGTGNTEAMAERLNESLKGLGADVSLFRVTDFDAGTVSEYDAIAFGCPAMGAEQLEDSEFEGVFNECEAALSGKKLGLFGSYGWGDGEWMTNWQETCVNDGANLVADGVICNDAPDDEAMANLDNLAKLLA